MGSGALGIKEKAPSCRLTIFLDTREGRGGRDKAGGTDWDVYWTDRNFGETKKW